MNFIKRTWAGSLAGKVVIGLGGLVAACLACSAVALIVPTRPQQRAEATVIAAAATVNTVTQASKAEAAGADAPAEVAIAVTILASPAPTATPSPTNTPAPTETPEPTATPEPTPTPAPPLVIEGNGDDVIDVTKSEGPMIARITHNGSGYFGVKSLDADGGDIDLLVNIADKYAGTVPIDFKEDEQTARITVSADGPWRIELANIAYAERATVPGVHEGSGDSVFFLDGADVDLIKINSAGGSYFGVFGYSDNGVDLLVNEVGPYSGAVAADRSTFLIVVKAEGPWSMDITAR